MRLSDEPPRASAAPGPAPPRLLDRVREAIRLRHYSIRTEDAYADWTRRFVLFHQKRHPTELGADDVAAFLTYLAVQRNVSASTQNQAKSALLFLYRVVLGLELPWLDEVVSAKKPRRLPVVLTPGQVRNMLQELNGTMGLIVSLLYGTGMRLLEGLRLRIKDIDFERREIVVRDGKGGKDRVTVLPENLMLPLSEHIVRRKALHNRDLAAGAGEVWLPDALAVKYPRAATAWGWQWVFPSSVMSVDPRGGVARRHHLNEASVQKAVSAAARQAGISKPCSPHVLRHYSESRNMPRHSGPWRRAALGNQDGLLGICSPATLRGVTGDDRDSDIRWPAASGAQGLVAGIDAAVFRADAGPGIRADIVEDLGTIGAGLRDLARPARDRWPQRRVQAC